MDKTRLNNEIILCRPAVRKARVAVIRKILKKMKLLKTCKLEIVKDKKLKKCERLFEKVQIMKKVRDDEVTKFALGIRDLETFLRAPKLNLRQSALAYLAKHEAIMEKINYIRGLIPNWERELPVLLNSLGKNKKKKLNNKPEIIKNGIKIAEPDTRVSKKNEVNLVKKNVKEKEDILKEITKLSDRKHDIHNFNRQSVGSDENKKSRESYSAEKLCENVAKIEKVDDPFFVEKKVIASKLLLENLSSKKNSAENLEKTWIKKETNSLVCHMNPCKTKKDSSYKLMTQKFASEPEEEKLHPSWAAKKMKLIKPFEGTKIKFSDN